MKYLVSHQGEQVGPYSLDEIVAQVRAKKLDLFDYVYDQSKDDWTLLMEYAPLAQRLKSNKPTARPPQSLASAPATQPEPTVVKAVATEVSAHAITEWFVLKGENRFGPFAYVDVVKMLQQKVVFPFDFVWHAGLESWKRAAEIPDFSPDSIRGLLGTAKDAFTPRKFARRKHGARVLVHDNLSLWNGQTLEISKGGVGITMTNNMVVPGQQVTVHFGSHEGWPAFNAVCEVVSKKFVNDSSPIEYGLRFLSLSQDAQEAFFKKVA